MATVWGYKEYNGPEHWHKIYPIAAQGKRQSPIDIKTVEAHESGKSTLIINYPDTLAELDIINTGAGWKVNVPSSVSDKAVITGGPLRDRYKLDQFHLHWGPNTKTGSEHTIDGRSFAGELHLVHWNFDKYESVSEAVKSENGLAVLGIFLDIDEDDNNNNNLHEEINKFLDCIKSIKYRDSKATLKQSINLYNLLPKKKSFFTYEGSLTTPPLYESVTWIVFDEPIRVTPTQIELFRTLCCNNPEIQDENDISENLVANYRPVQPLNGRQVLHFN